MEYYAVIKEINSLIEEEMILEINGFMLACFVNSCPFEVAVGETYLVDISVTLLDEIIIKEVTSQLLEINRINEGFSHNIRGKIKGDSLESIITFNDDLFYEYRYLEDVFVELTVDRITVDFIK